MREATSVHLFLPRMRRTVPALAVGATAALVAGMAPAVADTVPVTVTVVNAAGGGRTLNLQALDGTASPSLSGPQSGFVANVTDSSYSNSGYTVSATMSNLAKVTGANTYDCNTTIPSSAVTVRESNGFDSSGMSAALTPVLTLAGSVVVAGTTTNLPAGTTVTGIAQTLDQTSLINSTAHQNTNPGSLPLTFSVDGLAAAASPFTANAAGPGTCTGNASPTAVSLLAGATAASAVQSRLSTIIGSGTTVSSLTGYVSASAVRSAIGNALGLGATAIQALSLTNVTASLNSIQNLVQSGLYAVSPSVAINTTGAATGQYSGLMTVTLVNN